MKKLLFLLLLWMAPLVTTAKVTPDRLGFLIVSDSSHRDWEAVANNAIKRLHELKKEHKYPDSLLPIMQYHLDKSAERKFCVQTLGVGPDKVPFLGVVVLRGKNLPQRPLFGIPRVTDAGQAAVSAMQYASKAYVLTQLGTEKRTYVGVQMSDLSAAARNRLHAPANGHVLVVSVITKSPAQKAGIRAQDVLLSIDGQPLGSAKAFSAMVKGCAPGHQIEIKLFRPGSGEMTKIVTIQSLPNL